jgi:hypothetical protein
MEKKDDGVRTVSFHWKIDDPGKTGNGLKPSPQRFTLYDRPFAELDEDEQRNVMMFKRTLIVGLDFTETESQKANAQKCIGRRAYITIKNTPDKNDPDKKWANVRSVQSPRLFAEKNAEADSLVEGITDF